MNLNATLVAQLVVFFILAWFTMKYVWPPIMKALDERAAKIAEGLAAAERGRQSLDLAAKHSAETVREGKDIDAALAGFKAFSESYQAAADQPQPLFRRRA